ncbi:hypothetical protein ABIA33_006467, partial [Streptacidiphilus sp. MAP12-16]
MQNPHPSTEVGAPQATIDPETDKGIPSGAILGSLARDEIHLSVLTTSYRRVKMTWNQFPLSPDGSASPSSRIAAVSRIPGSMEFWWIATDGSVQGAFWYDGQPWGRYELAPAGSASTNGGIAAVSRIPTSMELWFVGANG